MHTKRTMALALAAILAVMACTPAVAPSASAPASQPPASQPPASTEPSAPAASPSEAALAVDPAEAVIPNVEPNAEIGFWTFFLSPTFDGYIAETIARFEATYPGVKVNWEDHQGTFQEDLNNAFSAGNAPDVINLSVGEGWVADYASRGVLLDLDASVPQEVKDIYFEGLWKSQLVDGKNFQFPWYQGIAVELINKRIYEEGAGLAVADFPKTTDGLPAVCKTIKDKTGALCDVRLTVNDLLAQMTYEGDVDVLAADGKSFTFDSAAGVEWLQMYVDMVKEGSVDTAALTTAEDRVGLLIFSAGQAPFYQTGPNLIREVKSNNAVALRGSGRRARARRQVRRRRQGLDGHLGQGRHQVPERVHRARAVLHEPAEHGRFRQAGGRLPVVRGGL